MMLECKKILVETEETDSINSESISIVITEKIPDESEINFIVSESVRNNCKFIIVWSSFSNKIEDEIDYLLESKGLNDISTTSHQGESEGDVINFVKYATFIGVKCFYCFVFSEKKSIKAESLIENIILR